EARRANSEILASASEPQKVRLAGCLRAPPRSWTLLIALAGFLRQAPRESEAPMPKYLIAYRKTDDTGQKPEWAVFTTESELSIEAHAVKERVVKRMSVLAEKLWGNGEVAWIGPGRLDDVLYRRDEAPAETSMVYGLVEE